jgi:cysteine desulfurase
MEQILFNHHAGPRVSPLQERAIQEAYRQLYAFTGATEEDDLLWTSSGTESINHVIWSTYVDVTRRTGKNHFLSSALEGAATFRAMQRLQDMSCLWQQIPADHTGRVTLDAVISMLTPRTALVSMSWAQGLTGVIQPIEEISAICRERGILFHVEATHVLGKGEFSFQASGADLLSFDLSSTGAGGLCIRAGVEISPFIVGGREQGGMRGGMIGISTLLESAKWIKEQMLHRDHYAVEVTRLRNELEQSLLTSIPDMIPLFSQQPRVPHITASLFPGISSDMLAYHLQQAGIWTSCGGNHMQYLSHILKSCKIAPPHCYSAVSMGLSHHTSPDEITRAVEIMRTCIPQIKSYATHLV